MRQPAADVRLDEAAMVIAAHIDDTIDVDRELGRLDELAALCRPGDVDSVIDLLFGRLGLAGDDRSYDDPLNSCLPRVLDRRLGIPISLSVLVMEVGRRAGIGVEGVGMPGHFLVRVAGDPTALIDPFGGGRRIDMDGCRRIFTALHGPHVPFTAGLLAPTPKGAILARLLVNLTASFTRRHDLAGRRWVATLGATLPRRPAAERLRVAAELDATGAFATAARVMDETADHIARQTEQTGQAAPADRLRAQARGVRARLN